MKSILLFLALASCASAQIISANLLYRLKSDTGVTQSGGRIDSITPHSGSVTEAATQGSTGSRPYYSLDEDGRPVINCQRPTNCWLNLPSTLSVNVQSMTIYVVHRDRSGGYFVTSDSYSGPLLGATNVSGVTGNYFVSGLSSDQNVRYQVNMDVAVTASDGTDVKFYNSAANGSASAVISGTKNDLKFGQYVEGYIYDFLVYSVKHTSSEVAQNLAALAALYPDIRTTPWTRNLVMTGDSITAGDYVPGNDGSWPLVMIWNWMPTWRGINGASSGSTASSELTKQPPLDWQANAAYANDVIVVAVGTNDMGIQGLTPAQAYANLVTLVQSYKTEKPWRDVWVGTVIPTASSLPATTVEYNQRIRGTNGYTGIVADSGATGYIDFQTGVFATPDPAYYADSLHPNALGAAAMAEIAKDTLIPYYDGDGSLNITTANITNLIVSP